ncbi:hypothetical protein [Ruminococcus albus]|nr:hypothetical protein [Ruminococcus albus]
MVVTLDLYNVITVYDKFGEETKIRKKTAAQSDSEPLCVFRG